ncbi:ABC transporter substrate-binding protein [Arenibaculum sp.]|jgi:multiple sugar transport system substrate-binding protein|uniref:ABC transporter substrate-binding protein n=1 Tax=Arenibaculum sp. TaxID=2865862 RepID=UPI002E12A668|nr:extracellular solute-binding protein [Arenibaculum sp.]
MTNRREFLAGAGALSLAAAFGGLASGSARAAAPISFVGWTFRPDMVQGYVDLFNEKYGEQVNYSTLPWPQFHQTLEARAFAGDIVDVMYCFHSFRERWSQTGLIRALDDLPGVDAIKKAMAPANLASLTNKEGQLIGLPYYTGMYIMIYNEPMLQQGGFQQAAATWDELIEHCVKLKTDKISEYPFLPNWNPTVTGTTPQFLTDCFADGARVFDDDNRLIIDQDPAIARVMERWQRVYELGLVTPEIFTKPSTTDVHRMMFTGRYAYHTNHSNYLQTIAGDTKESLLAPKKAKMAPYPGKTGDTYMWTDSYVLNARTEALESSWKLMRFVGANLHGDWHVQRQWALASGLDNPYPALYDQPDVVASYANWIDLPLLRRQYEKGKVISAFKEAWYPEYDARSVPILHDMIRKSITVPEAIKSLVALQKSLA